MDKGSKPGREATAPRAARLKTALRANLARRKAQARARATGSDKAPEPGPGKEPR